MKKKLKRIVGILKSSGIKKTGQMVIVKLEKFTVNFLTPVFIYISKLIQFFVKRKTNTILILLEQRFSVCSLNRAFDPAEFLKMAGYNVSIASPVKSLFSFLIINKYSAIVFQRNVNSKLINAYLEAASKYKIKTVYDCDDLLFDPSMSQYLIEDLASSSERWLRVAKEHHDVYKRCAFFLTSTNYLEAHSLKTDAAKKSLILRNGLNKRYIDICDNLNFQRSQDKEIIIGYMSGTASHNADFRLIEKALFAILEKYSYVYLKIVGLLNIPDYFYTERIKNRILRIPFVNFYDIPSVIKDFSINIAPSIINNPFTEGKSELKYVYAGYMGIPTIASATDAFRTAITNGENGYLSYTEEDWYKYFELLVTNAAERERIGKNAKLHIEKEYVPAVLSKKANFIFQEILNEPDTLNG